MSSITNPVLPIPNSVFNTDSLLESTSPGNVSTSIDPGVVLTRNCLVRNTERINNIVGTTWTITNINTSTKWITLDRTLPCELSQLGTGISERWIAFRLDLSPGNNFRIVDTDFELNRVKYDAIVGTVSVGHSISFFNPFRQWYPVSYSTILPPGTQAWNTSLFYPGPMWLHSDGDYRMIVVGYNGSIFVTGLASSPDLITWTVLNGGNPMYQGAVAPFDKTWTQLYVMFSGSAIPIPNTSNYACLIRCSDGVSGRIGVVTFDEDFNMINIPTNAIVVPDNPTSPNWHDQYGSLIYYDGVWYVSTCRRHSSQVANDQDIYVLRMNDILDNSVTSKVTIQHNPAPQSWMAYTLEYTTFLIYNGSLFLFLSGEVSGSDFTAGGPTTGNRQYGMYIRNSSGDWEKYNNSPLFCNPANCTQAYTDIGNLSEMWDHMGGGFSFLDTPNGLYVSCIVKGSIYRAYMFKLNE